MATVPYGITGPFIGRVGTVVGYMWKGRNCMRSYVAHIRYPNTAEQQRERDWFVSMVRFASAARPALKLGMCRHAKEAGMTEGNYFVMMNKQRFAHVDGEVIVDYSKLTLSYGSAADVYFHPARFEENEVLTVDFEKYALSLRASGDDSVYLYVYAPACGEGCLSAPTPRRNKRVSLQLPTWWAGQEVHVYGFVVDREGRPSNTTYVGVGRVNHYEDRGRYIPVNKNWKDFVDIANELNADSTPLPSDGQLAPPAGVKKIDLFGDPPEVP